MYYLKRKCPILIPGDNHGLALLPEVLKNQEFRSNFLSNQQP